MENQFLLIIKKRDEDKFRLFKNGKYNKATNEILKKNGNKYVWGIHKGIINNSIWNKIRKNDKIYLTVERENFRISGILSKKIKNLKFGESIYPTAIDKKQINYFLFFEKLDPCRISYDVLKNMSKSKIFLEEGIHKIEKSDTNELVNATLVKKLPLKKIIGQPKRKRRSGMEVVRNPTKIRQLKTLYDNKCQIIQCDFRLEYYSKNKNVFYSEVHHYNPLKKQSDDDFGNMLVLCPNHHKEFDYSVKFIDMDGITIIDGQGKLTGETLQFSENHKLDIKNIESQLGQ